jgi:hypothetical protein
MPIKTENKKLYPPNWRQISQGVRERASYRCENCRVRNYSVGYRDAAGQFHRLGGSGPCDCAGDGLVWPSLGLISYCEALEFAKAANTGSDGTDGDGHHYIVIVLTVAHLDHNPSNCHLSNLKALCQRCHLRYDIEHHKETAYQTRRKGKAMGELI